MKSNIKRTFFSLIGLLLLTTACSNFGKPPTPTEEPLLEEEFIPVVSATGKVVPAEWATLSVSTGGIIAEVLVSEGEQVKAGQVLLRLEGKEQLQAAISAAEFELSSAKHALNALYDPDFDLLAAQMLKARDDAQKALDDLLNPELQQALALQAIADAEKAVEQAQKRLNIVQSTASQADIDAAKAQVVLAKDALDKAKDAFEPYENKPEDNLVRANLQAKLAAAQQAYDAAVRRLNALQSTGNETDIAVARADLATAQAQLSEAKRDWEKVKEGPDPEDVALLEAQIANYEREYERLKKGPDPDDVALAEARVSNAEEQLAAAKAALEDLQLVAPFDGTVSEIYVRTGEWVAPGQPVLVLADLDQLRVETTDLNEIDVAQIDVGKTAIVTFDALPDVVVEGTITRIANKATEGAGVNYTVLIELAEVPPALRWGMTAFVDVKIDE